MKNNSTFYLLTSTFNFLTSAVQGLSYWHYDDGGVWFNSGLFDRMKLIIIALTSNLTFIGLINLQTNFTLLINFILGLLALLSKLATNSHRFDFHKFDLSLRQFTLLINCTLNSTMNQGLDAVMTTELSSHKSRYICHFRIATLSRGIIPWYRINKKVLMLTSQE